MIATPSKLEAAEICSNTPGYDTSLHTVSFGYGVGDFIAIGTLAWRVYKSCRQAPESFGDIAFEVASLGAVLKEAEETIFNEPIPSTRQEHFKVVGDGCRHVLEDLDNLIEKYQSLGTQSKRTWDRVGWVSEGITELRARLTSNMGLLTALISVSQADVGKKLDVLLKEFREGKRQDSVISYQTLDSLSSEDQETWHTIRKQLEDIGITVAAFDANKDFIFRWFEKAEASGAFEEQSPDELSDAARHVNPFKIASETLSAISDGKYNVKDTTYFLHTRDLMRRTRYHSHHWGSDWLTSRTARPAHSQVPATLISIFEISTLSCARRLSMTLWDNSCSHEKIGVLSFGSATIPGGSFEHGVQGQEESIARSSNLYRSLRTDVAQGFYEKHNSDPGNHYYTHGIIHSPAVEVFRDDEGSWTKPLTIDVLTCAAVNAGEVLRSNRTRQRAEREIEFVMKERMARILFLFEQTGIKNLVLGSFGTGHFGNDVGVVARLWAELLSISGARFERSFDRVFFAILERPTVTDFRNSFAKYP